MFQSLTSTCHTWLTSDRQEVTALLSLETVELGHQWRQKLETHLTRLLGMVQIHLTTHHHSFSQTPRIPADGPPGFVVSAAGLSHLHTSLTGVATSHQTQLQFLADKNHDKWRIFTSEQALD